MARILVSMKDDFLKSIDKLAQSEQRSRSELIREALRSYVNRAKKVTPKKALDEASILEDMLS